jgi:dephospho-CoA kinase
MIKFAITGGIGSGKSYVSSLLEERGIPIYNADLESKRLTVQDGGIRKELVALLGEDIYQGATLNKPLLASYLFANSDNAVKVNSIIHPRVKDDFRRWVESQKDVPLVGLESAIHYESGFDDVVDQVVMVYAPEAVRLQRAMKRDNATEEQVRARMSAQMDDEEKRSKADFVLMNDGIMPLDVQLDDLVRFLKKGK